MAGPAGLTSCLSRYSCNDLNTSTKVSNALSQLVWPFIETIVRSGRVTCSPKASPGCKGDGAAGLTTGGAGGIGSFAFGFGGAGGFCAAAGPAVSANATAIVIGASLEGDITVLRRSLTTLRTLSWPLVNPRLFAI